ncbi:MAG: FAD-dependent oxidoreductase, partial [Methanobacterium sp.]
MDEYDVIIIGSGPAGLTAGIYAGRQGLKTLILEKQLAGGAGLMVPNME